MFANLYLLYVESVFFFSADNLRFRYKIAALYQQYQTAVRPEDILVIDTQISELRAQLNALHGIVSNHFIFIYL
jgi:hypothetical protein